mmetsp:Transcript_3251/g.7180  ORF Transcript_3251/g.7180 Transcript_3251/m.7180 type:complete len:229 (-) Transcript_3251:145-831(-)|eukprot:scaffold76350_cov60-Phaeocystis_antarctica.AAC.2
MHADDAQREGVGLVDDALGIQPRHDGGVERLCEPDDLRASAARVEAYRDDDALARHLEPCGDLPDRRGVTVGQPRALTDRGRACGAEVLRCLDHHPLDVHGHGDVDADALRECDGHRVAHDRHELQRVRYRHAVGEAARREQARLIDVLELAVRCVGARLGAGDGNHRHLVELRVEQAGGEVGGARARGGDAGAEAAGARELGVRRRHQRGVGLVARTDPAKLLMLTH